jgi:hypothetical protein
MYTMEDLKTNRDAQITVGSILFFVLAFPIYFGIAAGNADTDFAGAAGDYQVSGELTYVVLDSGTESIADGDTWSMTYNTDAVNNADELNIVGVRISMTYEEDETGGEGALCPGGSAAADTITGTASHLTFNASGDGQNNGGNGAHDVSAIWYNESMIGANVSGLSLNEIKAQIDSMGAGLGDHTVSIAVDAEAGNEPSPNPTCSRSDGGETVDYTVEMIVLDYTIEAAQGSSED